MAAVYQELKEREQRKKEEQAKNLEERRRWGRAEVELTLKATQKLFAGKKTVKMARQLLVDRLSSKITLGRDAVEWAVVAVE